MKGDIFKKVMYSDITAEDVWINDPVSLHNGSYLY